MSTEQLTRANIGQRIEAARLPAGVVAILTAELSREGVTEQMVSERIFEELARRSDSLPDQRAGLAVQSGDPSGNIETLSLTMAEKHGISKESAMVRVLNQAPQLYDAYLRAHPHQTGHR